MNILTMPDDLDPTTARLVSELASRILPELKKSLNVSIPTAEFMSSLERNNRAGSDLKAQIERSIRSSIDDNRAGRSVMMQSLGTLSEEISAMKKAIMEMPGRIERANVNVNDDSPSYDEKLNEITELLNELIKGLSEFSQTYAKENRKHEAVNVNVNQTPDSNESYQNSELLDRLLNRDLPALEGLVRALSKSSSNELQELSREIGTMNEQNNAALLHEVHEAVSDELKKLTGEFGDVQGDAGIKKLLKICVCLSGASFIVGFIMLVILLFR